MTSVQDFNSMQTQNLNWAKLGTSKFKILEIPENSLNVVKAVDNWGANYGV